MRSHITIELMESITMKNKLHALYRNSNTTRIVYEYGVHSAMRLMLNPNVYDNALGGSTFDGFKVTLNFLYKVTIFSNLVVCFSL